jgi:hypothetical protein
MIYHRHLMYKVTAFGAGLVITAQHDHVELPDAVPLMVGPGNVVPEYLARFIHAREAGKDIHEAHKIAIAGAKIADLDHGDNKPPVAVFR